ncbi:MAG: hypothetical protein GTO18_00035 [Anaerolineales bacterium]|nr:hypothetical protein [Anaerolineales bacterium]
MKPRQLLTLACLLMGSSLVSCQSSQAQADARATEVAAEIFATQTVVQALITPSPTSTTTPTKSPFPELSGVWRGSLTTTRAGRCSIAGKNVFEDDVMMAWTVSDSGEISIVEAVASDPEGLYEPVWSGIVDGDLNVQLHKVVDTICGDEAHTYTGDYEATITKQNGSYSLEMETTEAWCPMMECIFDLHYSISKSVE